MKKFAVIKLSSLGDIIHTFPLLSSIKRNIPEAHISWIVDYQFKDVIECNNDVDEILPVKLRRKGRNKFINNLKNMIELSKLHNIMSKKGFDITIDAQGLIKSGIITYMTRAPIRIGFEKNSCRESFNSIFTNLRISPESKRSHVIFKNMALLKGLNISDNDVKISIRIPDEERSNIMALLNEKGIKEGDYIIGINPSSTWVTKRWKQERFANLSDKLISNYGAKIVIIGGKNDECFVDSVLNAMKREGIKIITGSIKELIATISFFQIYIGNDSGPIHIASAIGIPCVGIFGPSSLARNGPFKSEMYSVQSPSFCSPCFTKRTCNKFICMDDISVDNILSNVERIIK